MTPVSPTLMQPLVFLETKRLKDTPPQKKKCESQGLSLEKSKKCQEKSEEQDRSTSLIVISDLSLCSGLLDFMRQKLLSAAFINIGEHSHIKTMLFGLILFSVAGDLIPNTSNEPHSYSAKATFLISRREIQQVT